MDGAVPERSLARADGMSNAIGCCRGPRGRGARAAQKTNKRRCAPQKGTEKNSVAKFFLHVHSRRSKCLEVHTAVACTRCTNVTVRRRKFGWFGLVCFDFGTHRRYRSGGVLAHRFDSATVVAVVRGVRAAMFTEPTGPSNVNNVTCT